MIENQARSAMSDIGKRTGHLNIYLDGSLVFGLGFDDTQRWGLFDM